MKKLLSSTALIATVIAVGPTLTLAQSEEQQENQQQEQEQQVAQQCLDDLNTLTARMNEEGFWVAGSTSRGFGMPGQMMPGTMPADDSMAEPPAEGEAMPAEGQQQFQSPRQDIGVLYQAARILARKGDEEGCQHLLTEITDSYDMFAENLREAGIDPANVTSWRQEQLAQAQPISEVEGLSSYTIDDIEGTDVRNPGDEQLGSISDVVFEPGSGQVSYVLLARGGFLGIGEDHIAVPWDQLRATPGLQTLVLDISEDEIENAPTVDPDAFNNLQTGQSERERIDEFWGQRQ